MIPEKEEGMPVTREELEEAILRTMSAIHEVRLELECVSDEQEKQKLWRRKKRLQYRQLNNLKKWEQL